MDGILGEAELGEFELGSSLEQTAQIVIGASFVTIIAPPLENNLIAQPLKTNLIGPPLELNIIALDEV